MGAIFRPIKSFLLWGYSRITWQYDLLCLAILAFIFLTPAGWFVNKELHYHKTERNSILIPWSDDLPSQPQTNFSAIEQKVRLLTGRDQIRVSNFKIHTGTDGKPVALEVDIKQ
ncbi:MAG: hypothetical protein ACRD63_00560 [Pyrinomonadaceae bacterium]